MSKYQAMCDNIASIRFNLTNEVKNLYDLSHSEFQFKEKTVEKLFDKFEKAINELCDNTEVLNESIKTESSLFIIENKKALKNLKIDFENAKENSTSKSPHFTISPTLASFTSNRRDSIIDDQRMDNLTPNSETGSKIIAFCKKRRNEIVLCLACLVLISHIMQFWLE